jgi:phospholipase/lecithinase/hemolysin
MSPGGTDFAVGGAELLQPVTLVPGLTIPSIEDQVAYYLAINGGHADPNALYVIEGGCDSRRWRWQAIYCLILRL